jgi:hypothetical protein
LIGTDDRPARKGASLSLARVQPQILELWRRAGAIDAVGSGRVFKTVREAVEAS